MMLNCNNIRVETYKLAILAFLYGHDLDGPAVAKEIMKYPNMFQYFDDVFPRVSAALFHFHKEKLISKRPIGESKYVYYLEPAGYEFLKDALSEYYTVRSEADSIFGPIQCNFDLE